MCVPKSGVPPLEAPPETRAPLPNNYPCRPSTVRTRPATASPGTATARSRSARSRARASRLMRPRSTISQLSPGATTGWRSGARTGPESERIERANPKVRREGERPQRVRRRPAATASCQPATPLAAKRLRRARNRDDRVVAAIGIVGYGPVGTIALEDCDRRAAGPLRGHRRSLSAGACAT
jgi:hypothetical protein